MGGLRVADLVAMPHLGIEVLAGAGGLERLIEWTHVSELPDPGPWLEGGEMLIVNGFGVPASGTDQARYISRLAEHRAVALAVGRRTPPIRREMLEAADALELPLLRLPKETPFVAISHLVANANQHPAQLRLVRNLQILDTLRLRGGIRTTTSQRFRELESISGFRLALLSVAGHPVLPEWPWTPEHVDVASIAREGDDHIVIDGGYALPVPVGSRVAAFLIALEQPDTPTAGLSSLQHVATVAALEVVDEYRRREARRRSGAEALAEVLAGRMAAADAAARLEQEGLPAEALVLVAFRAREGAIDDDELHHALADRGLAHLMLRQDELYVVMPDRPEALAATAAELDLIAGVSAVVANPARMGLARRETLWALAGAGGAAAGRVVRFASADGFAHWLPTDLAALGLMVDATLGPIIAYDAAHSTDLVRSLSVFFRNQRQLKRSAAELYIHEHTLAYRLKRIEAITGRKLSDLQDSSELWLALKALPVVRDQPAVLPAAAGPAGAAVPAG